MPLIECIEIGIFIQMGIFDLVLVNLHPVYVELSQIHAFQKLLMKGLKAYFLFLSRFEVIVQIVLPLFLQFSP